MQPILYRQVGHGDENRGQEVAHADLGDALHVETDSEDEQTAHSGHFRDDRVAEQRLKHAGQQRDGALVKKDRGSRKSTPTPRVEASIAAVMPSIRDLVRIVP